MATFHIFFRRLGVGGGGGGVKPSNFNCNLVWPEAESANFSLEGGGVGR